MDRRVTLSRRKSSATKKRSSPACATSSWKKPLSTALLKRWKVLCPPDAQLPARSFGLHSGHGRTHAEIQALFDGWTTARSNPWTRARELKLSVDELFSFKK
jgi:hypothetical protein